MNVGIIGGGTMGLTLAYRIARAGHRVTVLEAAPQIGGLATWFDYGDFTWDKFYHVILRSDAQLTGLIDDLGIAGKLNWSETKTGFLWNGRHLPMSSHWEFLTFPALSMINKIRLAAGILRAQRINDPPPLETISASDWLISLFGRQIYEAIWEPLVESKYGELKDRVPATIMWATIKRYYSTRSKGGGKESMGYLSGGLKALYDALSTNISEGNSEIRTGMMVDSLDSSRPDTIAVHVRDHEIMNFDKVISTLPTQLFDRIAPAIDGLQQQAARPQFLGVICLALVLRRPLSPFYVTNLIQKGFPFAGVIELSNLTGADELNGHRLVMLPRYDTPDSEWFEHQPQFIADKFVEELRPVWPDIDDNIVRYYVHRAPMVQALWISKPPTHHRPVVSDDGKIWCVNAELAGRDTLNNNAIVRVANAAAVDFLNTAGDESAMNDAGNSAKSLERSSSNV